MRAAGRARLTKHPRRPRREPQDGLWAPTRTDPSASPPARLRGCVHHSGGSSFQAAWVVQFSSGLDADDFKRRGCPVDSQRNGEGELGRRKPATQDRAGWRRVSSRRDLTIPHRRLAAKVHSVASIRSGTAQFCIGLSSLRGVEMKFASTEGWIPSRALTEVIDALGPLWPDGGADEPTSDELETWFAEPLVGHRVSPKWETPNWCWWVESHRRRLWLEVGRRPDRPTSRLPLGSIDQDVRRIAWQVDSLLLAMCIDPEYGSIRTRAAWLRDCLAESSLTTV